MMKIALSEIKLIWCDGWNLHDSISPAIGNENHFEDDPYGLVLHWDSENKNVLKMRNCAFQMIVYAQII